MGFFRKDPVEQLVKRLKTVTGGRYLVITVGDYQIISKFGDLYIKTLHAGLPLGQDERKISKYLPNKDLCFLGENLPTIEEGLRIQRKKMRELRIQEEKEEAMCMDKIRKALKKERE